MDGHWAALPSEKISQRFYLKWRKPLRICLFLVNKKGLRDPLNFLFIIQYRMEQWHKNEYGDINFLGYLPIYGLLDELFISVYTEYTK
jgi:hypothetical protein